MSQTKEEFIRYRKIDVSNYEQLLKAILVFKRHVEQKYKSPYYFGGKLFKKDSEIAQTPDIIINLKNSSIVGEAKRSLRNLRPEENKEQYIRRFIEGDIIKQLKKYDSNFVNTKLKSHDLMLFVPEFETEAIGILKYDYLDKENPFDRKFALVVYSITVSANTNTIILKQDYGSLTDRDLFDDLRRGIKSFEGEIIDDLGRYKIYEENLISTPIEYVMLILWDSIFNEIINSSEKNSILERYTKREKTFEVKLSKLMNYLRKMYTLPVLPDDSPFKSNGKQQFKKKVVEDAMDMFCYIGLAKIKSKDKIDTSYEVTLKALPQKNELEYFLKKIYDIQKDKPKELDSSGIEKLNKYFEINNDKNDA